MTPVRPPDVDLGPELRCSNCNKLLAEALMAGLITCPRCKTTNVRILVDPTEPQP